MSGLIGSVFSFFAPLLLRMVDIWVRNSQKQEDIKKSYYAFLDAVDKSGAAKVANHISAVRAKDAEVDRLLKEIEMEKNKNEQK